MPKTQTHYDTLQISRTASDAVVRAAYRGLSQQYHPDKNLNDQGSAERIMKAINEAYSVLSNPTKRREYDEWIAQMEAEPKSPKNHHPDPRPPTNVIRNQNVVPMEVTQACTYLWGSLVFSGMSWYFSFRHEKHALEIYFIIIIFLIAAIYAFLTLKIERGRNWARITYLCLSIISFPLDMALVIENFSANAVHGLISGCSVLLPFLAFWLVFTNPGALWFKDVSQSEKKNASSMLRTLADLHAQGLITDDEFAKKKAEVLSSI